MLAQLSAYHRPPSNAVVVSGVFLGEVIFKMMREGFTSVFDDHMLYLIYNQQINSTVKGMNIDLSLLQQHSDTTYTHCIFDKDNFYKLAGMYSKCDRCDFGGW